MKILLYNHIENAVESLRSNRLRTVLTITGVTIGIASIVSILSLASGASMFLANETTQTRSSIAIIRASTPISSDSIINDARKSHSVNTLTTKDVTSLQKINEAKVAPLALLRSRFVSKDQESHSAPVANLIGTTSDLGVLAKLKLVDGEFLNGNNDAGIVMGNQLAVDLFGTDHAIGNLVSVRGQSFTVIGVLRSTQRPVNYLGIDLDRAAFVELASIGQLNQSAPQIQQIILESQNDAKLKPLVANAKDILSRNHNNEPDFEIITGDAITRPTNQTFSYITVLVAAVAGISLLVGGIGIMNIMLVNVAERQREIGIRKAIGATDSQVISQFLIESSIIGLLGGILGYLIGIAIAYAISLYLPFTPVLEWQVAMLAIGTAVATGVVFGIYPSIRAAKKDPIESLRF